MGPQTYMQSVVDRNVFMQRISQPISDSDKVRMQINRNVRLTIVSNQQTIRTEISVTAVAATDLARQSGFST
jgi:hypothetical protein